VVFVGATQHQHIIVVLIGNLLFYIFDDVLFKADHALLILHLALGQLELKSGEV
jgi:hypothetical protein